MSQKNPFAIPKYAPALGLVLLAMAWFGGLVAQTNDSVKMYLPKEKNTHFDSPDCAYLDPERTDTAAIVLEIPQERKALQRIMCHAGIDNGNYDCQNEKLQITSNDRYAYPKEMILGIPNFLKYVKASSELQSGIDFELLKDIWDEEIVAEAQKYNNMKSGSEKGGLNDVCPVYILPLSINQSSGTAQMLIRQRIMEACEVYDVLLRNYISQNPEAPQVEETYYQSAKARMCQQYVLLPEIEKIEAKLVTYGTTAGTNSAIGGLEYDLAEAKSKPAYLNLKTEKEDLIKQKKEVAANETSPKRSNEEVKQETTAIDEKIKAIERQLENREMGLPYAMATHNAYLSILRGVNSTLSSQIMVHKTGWVSVDPLCIGNECRTSIIESEEGDSLFDKIVTIMLGIAGTFGVLMLVVAGSYMVLSRGDEDMLNTGKKTLTLTLVGLAMIFGAYIVVQGVISVLFNVAG